MSLKTVIVLATQVRRQEGKPEPGRTDGRPTEPHEGGRLRSQRAAPEPAVVPACPVQEGLPA